MVTEIYDKLLANGALPCAATLQVASQIAVRRMLDKRNEELLFLRSKRKIEPTVRRNVLGEVRRAVSGMNGKPWTLRDFESAVRATPGEVKRRVVATALQKIKRAGLICGSPAPGFKQYQWTKKL